MITPSDGLTHCANCAGDFLTIGGRSNFWLSERLTVQPNILLSTKSRTRTGTGLCMRVRRSSDNTELDIYFKNGYADWTAISTFVGTGSGYVTRWYDQISGGTVYASQATATNQPRVVNAGVPDGKIVFSDTLTSYLVIPLAAGSPMPQPATIASTSYRYNDQKLFDGEGTGRFMMDYTGAGSVQRMFAGTVSLASFSAYSTGLLPGIKDVNVCIFNGATSVLRRNKYYTTLSGTVGTNTCTNLRIGTNSTTNGWFIGSVSEVAVWGSVLSEANQVNWEICQ